MNLYDKPAHGKTRWVSFENSCGGRAVEGLTNQGAKGFAFDRVQAGETKELLNIAGSGEIRRIWLTVTDRSPEMLRSLRLDIYWDGAATPAVSCPLGDFFGIGLGQRTVFECQLFSDPEGRSFNCFIPMPFRTSARMTLTNESSKLLPHLFYDINLLMDVSHSDAALYFHTHWRRESPNVLGRDYMILPKVTGQGRFLGTNVGIIRNPVYGEAWWGEGEVKAWFGNDEHPTLCGTGAEDYIGTAWGLGKFANRTQGCPISDTQYGQWAFYRYHLDDPIYFDDACAVGIQTIGGTNKKSVQECLAKGLPLIPVSSDPVDKTQPFVRLLQNKVPVSVDTLADGWVNFWRQDDWSSAAYFYLNAPSNDLPALAPVKSRTQGLLSPDANATKRADG